MGMDQVLIQRAIEGDERSLQALWSQHSPHIDAVIRRLVGGQDTHQAASQGYSDTPGLGG